MLQQPSECHPRSPWPELVRNRSGGSERSLTDRTGQRAGRKPPCLGRLSVISFSSAKGDETPHNSQRRSPAVNREAINATPLNKASTETITVSIVSSAVNNTMTPKKTVEGDTFRHRPIHQPPKTSCKLAPRAVEPVVLGIVSCVRPAQPLDEQREHPNAEPFAVNQLATDFEPCFFARKASSKLTTTSLPNCEINVLTPVQSNCRHEGISTLKKFCEGTDDEWHLTSRCIHNLAPDRSTARFDLTVIDQQFRSTGLILPGALLF